MEATFVDAPQADAAPPAEGGALVVYQDTLTARMESQITDLQTALEHERAQSRRLTEALAREQTLRAYALEMEERRGRDGWQNHRRYTDRNAISTRLFVVVVVVLLLVGIYTVVAMSMR